MSINAKVAKALGHKVEYNPNGNLMIVAGPYHTIKLPNYERSLDSCTELLKELSIHQVSVYFDPTVEEWRVEGTGIHLSDPSLPQAVCKGFLALKQGK